MFSIIIPVFNAEKYIDQCLSALNNLDYPKDKFEIIAIDNGSTDKTLEIIKNYKIKLFSLPKVTISKLRNFGASKAKGEILAFIDADCIAPIAWLSKASKLLEKKDIGAVGSWYALPEKTTYLERMWNAHMSTRRSKIGDIDWMPSGNLIIPKDVYNQIEGFNESLTTSEDVDICQRIHSAGFLLYTHPDLAVIHLGESKTLKHFFFKEKWRGEGVIQNFIHEFPRVKYNNAIAFTAITFLSLIAIFIALTLHSIGMLKIAFIILFLVPAFLAVKACSSSRKWFYFIPLTFVFLIYAFARISSMFSPKVWKK